MRPVYIEWLDASGTSGWEDKERLPSRPARGSIASRLGRIRLVENEQIIVIAQNAVSK
jgi:hypothetical protein